MYYIIYLYLFILFKLLLTLFKYNNDCLFQKNNKSNVKKYHYVLCSLWVIYLSNHVVITMTITLVTVR